LSSRLEIAHCLDISLAGQFVFQVYRGKIGKLSETSKYFGDIFFAFQNSWGTDGLVKSYLPKPSSHFLSRKPTWNDIFYR
jgi:hypothetical protein